MNALKGQALKIATNIASEIGTRPFRNIIVDHTRNAADDLVNKFNRKFQEGDGLFNRPFMSKKLIKSKKKQFDPQSAIDARVESSNNQKKKKKKKAKAAKSKQNKKAKTSASKLKTRILDIFSRQ